MASRQKMPMLGEVLAEIVAKDPHGNCIFLARENAERFAELLKRRDQAGRVVLWCGSCGRWYVELTEC